MQIPEPQAGHLWRHQLIGEWSIESECIMGPDQPPMKTTGRETFRTLGKFWTIGEGAGNTPEGGSCDSIMTLGYDPRTKRFVGSFVASAMTHLGATFRWYLANVHDRALSPEAIDDFKRMNQAVHRSGRTHPSPPQ